MRPGLIDPSPNLIAGWVSVISVVQGIAKHALLARRRIAGGSSVAVVLGGVGQELRCRRLAPRGQSAGRPT
jgi:hypothetical protein